MSSVNPRPIRRVGSVPAVRAVVLSVVALTVGLALFRGQRHAPSDPGPVLGNTAPVPVPAVAPVFAAVPAPPLPSAAPSPVPPPPPTASQVAGLAAAAAAPPPAGNAANLGLVVCEPVGGTDASLAAFGSGCGRWLHLTAAGQPALGATPLWNSLQRAQTEMGREDLRLTPDQAVALASVLGVTHVATGEIRGDAAHCTLTYRLWRLPQQVPVGAPLTLAGSEAQVVTGLPGLARDLDARLGVRPLGAPGAVALSPAELAQVGALARYPQLTDGQTADLASLAGRCPLAGLFLLNSEAASDQTLRDRTVAALVRRQSDNPLVLEQVAEVSASALRPYAALVAAQVRRNPQSFLLARVDGLSQGEWGTREGEWRAARQCVADAPDSPTA